jgi:hypothetical protein
MRSFYMQIAMKLFQLLVISLRKHILNLSQKIIVPGQRWD